MVQRPLVPGKQTKVRLNIFDGNLPGRVVGSGDGQDKPALPQSKRIELKLEPPQRPIIERHLKFGQGQARTGWIICFSKPNVFSYESLVPSKSQSRELKVKASRAQFLDQ